MPDGCIRSHTYIILFMSFVRMYFYNEREKGKDGEKNESDGGKKDSDFFLERVTVILKAS